MKIHNSLSVAVEAFLKEEAMIQEQRDCLHLQQGFRHFLELSEPQLRELLKKMHQLCHKGQYSITLLTLFQVTIEERIAFLRTVN